MAPSPALSQPTLAEPATVIFGKSSPDTGFLVGFEGVEKAFLDNRACGADGGGLVDQSDGWSGGADREEDVGVGVSAGRKLSPVGHGQHVLSPWNRSYALESEVFHKVGRRVKRF